MAPTPKPGILDIAPYVGGRAAVAGVDKVIKLSSNESPLGPSPHGGRGAGQGVARSGTLSRRQRADPARGHRRGPRPGSGPHRPRGDGSDALLTMLANAYLRPGDEVMFSEHAFHRLSRSPRSPTAPRRWIVPDPNLRVRCRRRWRAVTPKTRIVFIANPNNPTGSYLTMRKCAACMRACRPTRCW